MKNKLLFLYLLVVGTAMAQTDSVKLKLTVTDSYTKRSLAGVSVIHSKTSITLSTNDKGILEETLNKGDLLVVNNSATLPSSFSGYIRRTGARVEIRLASFQGPSLNDLQNWLGFSFGSGDWKMSTEDRGPAPQILTGDQIVFGDDLFVEIIEVQYERLLRIRFVSDHLAKALYKYGRPIQYSYLNSELKIWDQQTIFSGAPISVEPPSAGFAFTWEAIFRLKSKGIQVATVTHGAGISSTGSRQLDDLLPLAEWYEVPERTADQINLSKSNGKKIVALGTTVLRALESAVTDGKVVASSGLTQLKIEPGHRIQAVTSLFTGMHELGSSHMEILNAFCGVQTIELGYKEASERGYLGHEYGDLSLLDCRVL